MFKLVTFLKESRKAVVAFVATAVVVFLQKHGVTVDNTEISALLNGVVLAALVWLFPNEPKVGF